ncbi:LacI family DNA-binding transcriptional regulator [Mameliella alba]|nr:LacI family DNA-binding transcriptional regulator [Mameliella alba]MBY6170955.1 LacI family DNA-binding transcriptional regulator [Mameliella alba]MBY6175968.1 LacI family DNA-binding transcriptional regulator [Mameliella alba]
MSDKTIRKTATSTDVARLAGVSRATVSRCFSEADTVRKDTRDRVMQAARELGYAPNQLARMLQTRTSDMIAVLTADFANPFQPALIEALTGGLTGLGKMPLLLKSELTPDAADELVQVALAYQVAAVVVTVLPVSDLAIRRCVEAETPLILLNRVAEDSRAISICGDLQAGARRAADVLVEGGHRRISMITGRAGHWTTRMRRGGFRHRLDEHGIDLMAQVPGDYTYSGGRDAALRIMEEAPKTEAIYACNDAMACGALDALRSRLGHRVPDDIAVIGFDNVPMAAWEGYGLSTIHQPINRLIGKVCDILETPDRGLSQAGSVTLESCRFVQRGSTRAVPLLPGDIDETDILSKGPVA